MVVFSQKNERRAKQRVACNDSPDIQPRPPVTIWGVSDIPINFYGGYCGNNKKRFEPLVENPANTAKKKE